MKDLPRLLIVSEATLSENSRGASRTLANLFENYPSDRLMIYAPKEYLASEPTSPRFASHFTSFQGTYIVPFRNRLGKIINPVTTAFNLQLLNWLPIENQASIDAFAPEVVLICPITSIGLAVGYKVAKYFKVPLLTYFMDDWIATERSSWMSKKLHSISHQLLAKSAGWLMISERLQEILSQRYQIRPKQATIVHNPVDLADKEIPTFEVSQNETFKVVYAGSIWQMHYDTIAIVAEAIFQLRSEGKNIELVLHTTDNFWNQYRDKWEKWQVTNGSFIPYAQLSQYLQRGDLLLVASSFLPEYAPFTRSSVQTKLTDYMVAGRAILSCGPQYSACNHFIKKWNCGLVCESDRPEEVKQFLAQQIDNRAEHSVLAQKAFEIVKNNFEKHKVIEDLYNFISFAARSSSSSVERQNTLVAQSQN